MHYLLFCIIVVVQMFALHSLQVQKCVCNIKACSNVSFRQRYWNL